VIRPLLALLGVAGIVAGCAQGPSGTPSSPPSSPPTNPPSIPAGVGTGIRASATPDAERVVVLAGTVGAMTLVTSDPGGRLTGEGTGPPSGLPPSGAWLSGDGSALLLTTLDGRAFLGGAGPPIGWQPGPGDLSEPHPLRAFGSIGPDGQAAFIEGDPGAGTTGRLVVESALGSVIRVVPLPTAAEGPPAWLPDGRIALIARDRTDVPETLLVESGGRTQGLGGSPLRSIGIGGRVVALIEPAGRLRIGSINAWLAGSSLQPVEAGNPDETALQAQPSPSGNELAVVVADAGGDATAVRILAAAGGWHEIARLALPDGSNRAVVSWLAAP
jgi:hypothetical protein